MLVSHFTPYCDVDTTFGIRHERDGWMIGDKDVKFQADNIVIDMVMFTLEHLASGHWRILKNIR